jgi:ABC-2 type transport system permease protein
VPHRVSGFHWASLAIDALICVASYALAARLPLPVALGGAAFAGDARVAGLWIALQAAGLVALGVYRSHPVPAKIARLLAGGLAGTAAAALVVEWRFGIAPLARAFYAVDLVMVLAAATAWRAVRVLWAARRRGAPAAAGDIIDRTTERASPVEMLAGVVRHRELLRNLVLRDLKLKYRGSVLGFVWSLLNPLAMVAAYTLAFTYILRTGQERYAFFVLLGLLAWSFFANSANMSTNAMIESAGLLKSVRFPRAILPIETVLFNLAQYLLTILVFLPLMLLAYGLPPAWPMLAFPAILLLQVALTTGVALMLAAVTVHFRDVRHLVEVTLSILFWMTPVLYSLDQIDGSLRGVIELSPLSPFVSAYQRIFYHALWPEPATWVLAAVYAVAGLAVGSVLFYSLEDTVGEQL